MTKLSKNQKRTTDSESGAPRRGRTILHRLKVNFFLRVPKRKDPGELKNIYCRLVYNSVPREFFTGMAIPPFLWESGRIKTINDTYLEYQKILDGLVLDALKIESELRLNNQEISSFIVLQRLVKKDVAYKNFHEVAREFVDAKTGLVCTIVYKRYERWLGEIKAFADKYFSAQPSCAEIGHSFVDSFFTYLQIERKLSNDLACRRIEFIKAILDFGVIHGHLSSNPLSAIRYKRENKPKLHFLSVDQVRKITNLQLEGDSLNIVRDGFLFQVFTGVAYVDLASLTPSNIYVDPARKKWLKVERSKTKNFAMIPLLPEALDLIHKYSSYKHSARARLSNWNGLIPVYDNSMMNKLLKVIGSLAGIPVHLMTTHSARKSFASIALNSGQVSIETVAAMLGHVNTKTTSKFYAQVNTTKIAREMENFSFFK